MTDRLLHRTWESWQPRTVKELQAFIWTDDPKLKELRRFQRFYWYKALLRKQRSCLLIPMERKGSTTHRDYCVSPEVCRDTKDLSHDWRLERVRYLASVAFSNREEDCSWGTSKLSMARRVLCVQWTLEISHEIVPEAQSQLRVTSTVWELPYSLPLALPASTL